MFMGAAVAAVSRSASEVDGLKKEKKKSVGGTIIQAEDLKLMSEHMLSLVQARQTAVFGRWRD